MSALPRDIERAAALAGSYQTRADAYYEAAAMLAERFGEAGNSPLLDEINSLRDLAMNCAGESLKWRGQIVARNYDPDTVLAIYAKEVAS